MRARKATPESKQWNLPPGNQDGPSSGGLTLAGPSAADPWPDELPAVDPLPEEVAAPRVIHAIWLGDPLAEDGAARSAFRANLGDAADRLGHEFTFVLWTSVSRGMFAAARATAAAGEPGWLAGVREMVTWAQRHGISLVNVDEVFDAANPMPLVAPLYRLEMAKMLPAGYAAASDLLRAVILREFGGIYTDGDNTIATSPRAELGRVLESQAAFAFGQDRRGYGNAVLMAPARHPGMTLYLSALRHQYTLTQPRLYGDDSLRYTRRSLMRWRGRGSWVQSKVLRPFRNSVLHRTGGGALTIFEQQSGMTEHVPLTAVITVNSDRSWDADVPVDAAVPVPAPPLLASPVEALANVLIAVLDGLQFQWLLNRSVDMRASYAALSELIHAVGSSASAAAP